MIERSLLLFRAVAQFGKSYKFGSKWSISDENPKGPVDCSGFTKWCYGQIGIEIPDGSTNQHAESVFLSPSILILPGDLVFLHTPLGPNDEHHVGMVYDKYFIIEARGVIENGVEIGNVCLHLRSEWEKRLDFVGYFRPKAVTVKEGV